MMACGWFSSGRDQVVSGQWSEKNWPLAAEIPLYQSTFLKEK
jgi:hypothetical protein